MLATTYLGPSFILFYPAGPSFILFSSVCFGPVPQPLLSLPKPPTRRLSFPSGEKIPWFQQGPQHILRFLITPFLLGYLTRVGDHSLLPWLAIVGTCTTFNGIHSIHSLNHPAKYNMLPIQPACLDCSYVKLGSIGVKSRICHSNHTWMCMFYSEILIWEDASIYRLTSFPVASNYVPTLNHETRDNTMEWGSFIVKRFAIGANTFFTCTKGPKVFNCFWHNLPIKTNNNSTYVLAININIKVDPVSNCW